MTAAQLGGVVPILPTPFSPNDRVDLDALAALVEFSVSMGVSAVGTPAFGSEFYKLDEGERRRILETVIAQSNGRLPVIAQCNQYSPRHAARLAEEAQSMGASAVNIALPRTFASSPKQLLGLARAVCDAVSVPVVVQDFYPAGEAVGLPFVVELHGHCSNFRYLKREEPGIGPLIRAVRQELGSEVGVFLGWGGMYVPELQGAGACGVMPGLALADQFIEIWRWGVEGRWADAYALFARIAPYLQFSLQNFEQFHHAEKRLLSARGVLSDAKVRSVTVELNEDARDYLDKVIEQLLPMLGGARGSVAANEL